MRRILLAGTAAGLCVAVATASQAQTNLTTVSGVTSTTKLQENTVTAQKRTQNLQKAPASITVLSGTTLSQEGKTQIGDILHDVVGVTMSGSSSTPQNIYIRGVGPQAGNTSSQVAIVEDGVSNVGGTGFGGGTGVQGGTVNYDIDQVEVARGPQGTAYGGDAGAGAIVINTKDPVIGKFTTGALFEVGSYALIHSEGYVNIPLGGQFAVRGSWYTDNRNGYYSNGTGNDQTYSGRIKVLWKPDDALSLVLQGQHTYQNQLPGQAELLDTVTNAAGETVSGKFASNPWTASPGAVAGASPLTTNSVQGKAIYNFGYGVLTAIPYWARNNTSSSSFNGTGAQVSQGYAFNTNQTASIEARVDSEDSSPIYWQLGVYDLYSSTPVNSMYQVNLSGVSAGPPPPPGSPTYYINNQIANYGDAYSTAVFTQTSVPLWFDNDIKINGGVRWQDDRTSKSDGLYGITNQAQAYSLCPSGGTLSCAETALLDNTVNYGEHWHNISWKGGAEWQATPDALLYGNVGTGYAPGTSFDLGQGKGPGGGSLVSNTPSQVLIQYSIGAKTRWFDNTLQLNAEAYITNYYVYNASLGIPGVGNVPATLVNSAYNNGFDADLTYLIAPDDRFGLQAGYNDSSFGTVPISAVAKEYAPYAAEVAAGLSGHAFQFAPRWTIEPSYQHTFPLNDGSDLTFRVNTQWQTRQYADYNENPAGENPDHTETNVYLTFASANGLWGVSVYGKNLENFPSITSFNQPGPGQTVATLTLGDPRTFGASFNVKY